MNIYLSDLLEVLKSEYKYLFIGRDTLGFFKVPSKKCKSQEISSKILNFKESELPTPSYRGCAYFSEEIIQKIKSQNSADGLVSISFCIEDKRNFIDINGLKIELALTAIKDIY